jgi:hypothetical protein
MKGFPLVFAFTTLGCVSAAMTCPDRTSTVSYKGLALTGNTAVSCVGSPLGGDLISVSGMDLMALAMMVAPLVAARQPPPAPTPAIVGISAAHGPVTVAPILVTPKGAGYKETRLPPLLIVPVEIPASQ